MQYWYAGTAQTGANLALDLTDPGWLYGATVFTTLRVYGQTLTHPLTRWSAHCDRLRQSVLTLGWVEPDWSQVDRGASQLAHQWSVLRLTLFPDGRELITGRSLPAHLSQQQAEGITAWVATPTADQPPDLYHRWAPDLKTGNYLPAWLAQRSARAQNADVAILTDREGNWVETTTGNLWGWADGTWWTPPVNHRALSGISRQQILEWLDHQGQSVQQQVWTPAVVSQLAAIAHSNAVVQIVPMHTVLRNGSRQAYPPNHWAYQDLRAVFTPIAYHLS